MLSPVAHVTAACVQPLSERTEPSAALVGSSAANRWSGTARGRTVADCLLCDGRHFTRRRFGRDKTDLERAVRPYRENGRLRGRTNARLLHHHRYFSNPKYSTLFYHLHYLALVFVSVFAPVSVPFIYYSLFPFFQFACHNILFSLKINKRQKIGTISVYSSDFARCFVEFQTSPTQYRAYQSALSQCEPGMPFDAAPFACARLPAALRWCGLDCVAAHYPQGVPSQADDDGEAILIVGPFDDSIVYQYDQPLALVQEMDGLRIITATNSEFLQCVPKSTASVFAMSSTAPGALLYEAVEAFNLRSARSYDLVRQIRDELTRAVDDCLEAASHEFSHSAQRALLKAASFGKSFLDFYTPEKFAEMCKTLRVLNAVREFDIGLPITIGEYIKLSAEGLVMRLVAMKHFLLAIRICDYLEMYNLRNDVVLTWACLKVNSGGSDAELCKAVSDTLRDYPGVSFAKVAETAFIEAGRKELALKVFYYFIILFYFI